MNKNIEIHQNLVKQAMDITNNLLRRTGKDVWDGHTQVSKAMKEVQVYIKAMSVPLLFCEISNTPLPQDIIDRVQKSINNLKVAVETELLVMAN